MRTGSYEIILPLIGSDEKEIEGKSLLVSGLYGAIDVVDSSVAQALSSGDISSLSLEMRERLAVRGHITRKDEEQELEDARLLGRVFRILVGHRGVGPIILPTFDCNFRCPYCFEQHRLSRGSEWLGREMKPEMVDAVFAGLQKLRDKGRVIDACTLYGGEPLLRENYDTVKNICEHAKAMGLSLSAITNGYDLDAFIDLMEEYDFRQLQVTVDGIAEINDKRRLHRDGLPTYERIMENVRLALDHGIDISLRVNTNADNIGGVKALIEDIGKKGFKVTRHMERREVREKERKAEKEGRPVPKRKGFFFYYFKAVSEKIDSPTRVSERMVLEAIIDAGIAPEDAMEMQSRYSLPMGELITVMEKRDYPSFSTAFCGAEQGALGVGPDGKLFTCWDLVAMDELAVGMTDVETGTFMFNFDKAKWSLRTSDQMEPCKTCPYIFICRGGCAAEAKNEHDDYFREYCGEIKEIFAYVAGRVAAKKWQKTGEEELTISLAGPLSRLTDSDRETIMNTRSRTEVFDVLKKAGIVWE